MIDLRLGDCFEQLKLLADNSIDSIVTDPPYGLAFMGKKWDYDVPSLDVWREAMRVLKPGGHLLSFGGTRTYHRMVVNIEDAGFEIRDQMQWIFGSGFPKSHNLKNEWTGWGTALKPANEPIVVARKPLEKGLTVAQNVLRYGTGALNIDASCIRSETWEQERGHLNSHANLAAKTESQGLPEIKESSATKSVEPISSVKESAELGSTSKMATGCSHGQSPAEQNISLSEKLNSSIEQSGKKTSEQFQKDLSCITKITTDSTTELKTSNSCSDQSTSVTTKENGQTDLISLQNTPAAPASSVPQGRWPSNCIFDEEAAKALDEQTQGQLHSAGKARTKVVESEYSASSYHAPKLRQMNRFDDKGNNGASRFFYVAKASKSERNAGLEGMPTVSGSKTNLEKLGPSGSHRMANAEEREAGLSVVEKTPNQNFHPTVKPIKLMSYLINLVTPPGGTVLEPFMGSGTTGVAAKLGGFSFIGIEREPDYFAIAQRRIESAAPEVKEPDPQLEFPA